MMYRGVGLKWCKANTSAKDDRVFSPPDSEEMFFQDLFSGRTLGIRFKGIETKVQRNLK